MESAFDHVTAYKHHVTELDTGARNQTLPRDISKPSRDQKHCQRACNSNLIETPPVLTVKVPLHIKHLLFEQKNLKVRKKFKSNLF